jgi:hypothetical protein
MTDWLGTKNYTRDALGRILSSTDFVERPQALPGIAETKK